MPNQIIPHPRGRHLVVAGVQDPPLPIAAEVAAVLDACHAEGLPVHVFEGWRHPLRQNELLARRPKVTNAAAWWSFHQFGLAVDLVFRLPTGQAGATSWQWPKADDPRWARVQGHAKACGLTGIKGERPHLQLAGIGIEDVRRGRLPSAVIEIARPVVEAMEEICRDNAVAEGWDLASAYERPLDGPPIELSGFPPATGGRES